MSFAPARFRMLAAAFAAACCVLCVPAAAASGDDLLAVAKANLGAGVHVLVTAQVPPYALVDYTNAPGEDARGKPARLGGQLLMQRFPFGWQVIDDEERAFARCQLQMHGISAAAAAKLLSTTSRKPLSRPVCDYSLRDVGRPADIAAVRGKMNSASRTITHVRIAGNYALGWWDEANAGGEDLYRKTAAGTWVFVTGGGGAMGPEELRKAGVPPAGVRALLQDNG